MTAETRRHFFREKILYNQKLALLLWFGLAFIAVMLSHLHHKDINIYKIFKYVYIHATQHKNLYLLYGHEYEDVNMYGPVFSVLIAPFALLPDVIGSKLWVLGGAALLWYAIMKLPVKKEYRIAILVLCSHEMMNTASWYQSNAYIAACILLGFIMINKGKDGWALFFILLATFIKIYGIVGLAFFFFSKDKLKFIGWFILWSVVFFLLPLLVTSWDFLIQSYRDWYDALVFKAAKNINTNIGNDFQDISVMGMIRRIFKYPELNNMFVYVPAVILFGLQYLQIKHYGDRLN
ncbi:MAG: glycosyltransferase family 87 protein [Ferruginibacter sp.]